MEPSFRQSGKSVPLCSGIACVCQRICNTNYAKTEGADKMQTCVCLFFLSSDVAVLVHQSVIYKE